MGQQVPGQPVVVAGATPVNVVLMILRLLPRESPLSEGISPCTQGKAQVVVVTGTTVKLAPVSLLGALACADSHHLHRPALTARNYNHVFSLLLPQGGPAVVQPGVIQATVVQPTQ